MPEKMTTLGGQGSEVPDRPACSNPLPAEEREDRGEQRRDLVQRRLARVDQVDDRAQQVAEQVARPGDRRDVEVDLVRRDDEAEQVEVDRPEHEIEDLAARLRRKLRSAGLLALGQRGRDL